MKRLDTEDTEGHGEIHLLRLLGSWFVGVKAFRGEPSERFKLVFRSRLLPLLTFDAFDTVFVGCGYVGQTADVVPVDFDNCG